MKKQRFRPRVSDLVARPLARESSETPPRSYDGVRRVRPRVEDPPKSGAPPARGKPLHLLRFDEGSKKFTLGEEALDCLRAVKGPVGVLAVCGRARQGKSFILNQLAGAAASNDAVFKVGPTVKPCTKGLWI